MTMLVVEVYARKDCKPCGLFSKKSCCVLCADVKDVISRVNNDIPFQFKEVDIALDTALDRRYNLDIPTVFINGKKAFKFRIDETEFRKKVRKEIIKAGLLRLSIKKRQQYT
ncbi:MAG: glutaredoxin family protein [Deltaproteobacteria bacterium]|nr:glutaredoxin family protein [Deltaproteobacteria bacterium]